ncbi:PAS domain-containing sensor histidine kinase [Acidisphaera rubrifaciens]|uniref:Sensor protein FixL n=1 Tax=Acidisphaera rubrifaciens HS-AP3 TaxID=1231350 RepID=A0A0D6P6E3_9PROT|nr:PAS domain-containing sensor histidine kinase [Acidisphaera rubrifaciens]GAN77227.1 two component hybrid sensor histidine kinase and transcriptional regulator [Acidisphaera rubrifaciens HS-AP3]
MTDGTAALPPEPADTARSLLDTIVASSNDAIIGKRLDGTITSWNAAAEALFGFSAAEMVGRSILTIIPPDRVEEEDAIIARVRRGETLVHFETERVAKGGRLVPVSLTISPVRDARGAVIGVSKVARDLSRLRQVYVDLKERQELFLAVLRTVPDGLIVIDAAGIVQAANPAVERIFHYAADELVGRSLNVLMPDADRAAHDRYLTHYLETGERRIIGIGRVLRGQRRDGTVFPMELQVEEVSTPGHRLFTGFVRDLTDRHARERRLVELQAQLIHLSRLSELGQTVSALAHEVNQPLAAIANYASGMRRMLGPDAAPELLAAVDKVAAQAERASRIVQGVRSLARKGDRPRRPEALRPVIDETAELALVGPGRDVTLTVRIGDRASHADIDRVQVQQVLFNLLRNAVQALDGRPVRRIEVTTRRRDAMVEVEVADTGPGLAEEVRSRLFQPFLTTKAEGLGVGLSICRTIVEAHGGEIAAVDRPGGGCVFTFSLPACDGPTPGAGDRVAGTPGEEVAVDQ